jgi:hypothetical protein
VATDSGAALQEIVGRLRQRYDIYYKPLPGRAGEERSIEVELAIAARAAHPQARVLARRRYVLAESIE